jgi:hypothetical protein
MARRVDIRSILQDEPRRRALCVGCIQALQNREGIDTTREQAEAAYDAVRREMAVATVKTRRR